MPTETWPTWFWFVLVVLATWRITHLFVEEDGPGNIIVRLRARLGDSVTGRALDCFLCLSLWVAAPAALLLARDVLTWFVAWLAISGAASLLERGSPTQIPTHPLPGDARYVVLRSETAGAAHDGAATTNHARYSDHITESDPSHVSR
jgi:hypothetical protein